MRLTFNFIYGLTFSYIGGRMAPFVN